MSPISCFCWVSLIHIDNCRWCARSGRLVRCSEGLWRFRNVSVCHVIFPSVTQWSVIRHWKFSLQDVMVTSDRSSGIWYWHIHVICSAVDTAVTWSNGINHWHFLHFWCIKSYGLLPNAEEWSLRNSGVSITAVATQNLYSNVELWKWNCSNEVTPVHYAFFNKLSCRRAVLGSVLVVQLVKKSLHFCWIWGFNAIAMIGLYCILSSAGLIHFTFSP